MSMLLDYLEYYGYESLAAFQRAIGLDPTGVADRATEKAMSWPRCGVPDHLEVRGNNKWNKSSLTYHRQSDVKGIPTQTQAEIIQAAFDAWAAHVPLSFAPLGDQSADISIGVGQGRADGFDGPGNTLAWAELPVGDDAQRQMKFDVDERWIVDPMQNGILMYVVAVHEFGHLLGLDHDNTPGNVMNPIYNPRFTKPQANDVARIQARYGKRPPPIVPTTPEDAYTIHVTGKLSIDGCRVLRLR